MNSPTTSYRFNSWNRFQVLCLAWAYYTEFCQSSVGAKPLKTLTVTGRRDNSYDSDECAFGVEVQGKTAQEAAVGGTKVINVVAMLRSRNVEKLKPPALASTRL